MACSRETFTFTSTSVGRATPSFWFDRIYRMVSDFYWRNVDRHCVYQQNNVLGTRNLKDKLLVVISSFRLAVAALTRHVFERSHDQTARRPSVISSFKLSDVKCNELPLCSCYTRTDRQTDKAVSIGIFQDIKSPKKKRETQGKKQKKRQ